MAQANGTEVNGVEDDGRGHTQTLIEEDEEEDLELDDNDMENYEDEEDEDDDDSDAQASIHSKGERNFAKFSLPTPRV
jgi:hypothetical protein